MVYSISYSYFGSLLYLCNISYVCMCVYEFLYVINICKCGPGSSVCIATDYGLDDPGIESRWGEIFRPSRPALRPTQPPVQWVPGPSRRLSTAGACCYHSPPSSAVVMEEQSYTSTHALGHNRASNGNTLPLPLLYFRNFHYRYNNNNNNVTIRFSWSSSSTFFL